MRHVSGASPGVAFAGRNFTRSAARRIAPAVTLAERPAARPARQGFQQHPIAPARSIIMHD
ncbi:hypothetical protein DF159_26990 [Burkholderia ubonensis]|nr:hypothetical protein DF159_26990 [Burkholderia ubonensis]